MNLRVFCLFSGGRLIYVWGEYLDVVQEPQMVVAVSPLESVSPNKRKKRRRRKRRSGEQGEDREKTLRRPARMVPDPVCPRDPLCSVVKQVCVCVSLLFLNASFFFY